MPPPTASVPQRLAELVRDCSVELSPRDALTGDGLRGIFDPGTTLFINNPPSAAYRDIVAAGARLRQAGFNVVPHVVARRLVSFSEADDFLRALAEQCGTRQILLLGGDAIRPAGPFQDALAVLSTGLLERHGITAVAFAGYPESHPQITAATLDAALHAKLAVAGDRGLATCVVTQFGFEATPILDWIARQRAAGVTCPIRIGLAGPASVATLAKYAVRCGIGASLRALTHRHAAIARILTEASPDALIDSLAAATLDGLHIFGFGGPRRTAAWRAQYLGRVTGEVS